MSGPSEGQTRGRWAEEAAAQYLLRRGLGLQARNFRSRRGEIDLIMRQGDTLVFVEVRYRGGHTHGTALETVDGRKRARIVRTAEHYLVTHPETRGLACRFDVVAVSYHEDLTKVQWLRNAFDA